MTRGAAGRIRVLGLPGHPVVMPGRHTRRPSPMWPEPPPLFPDWFPAAGIRSAFEIVDTRPDVMIMTLSYHLTVADLEYYRSLQLAGPPLVLIYTLDDLWEPCRGGWDREAGWAEAIRGFALGADLLAGAQLPASLSHPNVLVLPLAPVVPFSGPPRPDTMAAATTDVYFSGAWYPLAGSGPPADSRDRTYRAYLMDRLRAGLPASTLDFRRVHFWRTNPLDPGGPRPAGDVKAGLLTEHAAALDRARISLAPAGYGYYTTRHSDTLARGRPLLTEPVHRYIKLPEPDRWEAGELALFYTPEAGDIATVAAKALGDQPRLQSLAENGWAYAQAHFRPDRQVLRLATAVRQLLATGGRP